MGKPASDEQLTDEQSFQEMVEGIAAFRPQDAKRQFPRFLTAVALSGALSSQRQDGLLICSADSGLKLLDLGDERSDEIHRPKPFRIVDFSERGLQIHFPCEGIAHFLNHSLSVRIGETTLPVQFSWCQQNPPIGRGGIFWGRQAEEEPELMALIASLGEGLVRFLVSSLRDGRLKSQEQAAGFTCYALLYSMRLKFREALASLWSLAKESEKQFETIQEIEETVLAETGVRFGRWELDDTESPTLDPVSAHFMRPFREYGCALIGLHEDSLLLEQDVLAALKRSILLPRQRRTEKIRIQQRLRSLYQDLLEARKLFPAIFDDPQFDVQFGYYSALVSQIEAFKEDLVYKAQESAAPSYFDPFDVYTQPDSAPPASSGLVILGPAETDMAGSAKPVNVYLHKGRSVSIACPHCGFMSDFPADQVVEMSGPKSVRCPCGSVFVAFFERRRYFRKAVRIYGKCKPKGRVTPQPMLLKDLSRGGLCFELLAEDLGPLEGKPDLDIGDTVLVEFRLDDDKRSLIRGEVEVRSVSGSRIGGEFVLLDGQSKKDLGFYFMS